MIKSTLRYFLLILLAVAILFPLFFALSISLQGDTLEPHLLPDFAKLDFAVFVRAFEKEPLLAQWIFNSFVVSSVVTLGQLFTSCLAAYALSYFKFKGKKFFLFFFLGTLMIPWESTIISNYLTIAGWGLKDSYPGLILPFLAGGFGIFLLRQFFMVIPSELHDAAVLEGCSRWAYLWKLLVPLARPALATLAIYTFLNTWNQFYWPLLIVDDPIWRTTQVGISAFRSTEIDSFNLQMAATLIVMAPTIILLALGQKQLVEGLTQGAVKG